MTEFDPHTGTGDWDDQVPLTRQRAGAAATALLIVPAFIALGASDGGYFPSSWGWSALVFAWAAMLALLLRETTLVSRLELLYLGAFTALLVWTTLSLLWTPTVTGTVLEIQRTLVYVTFAIAVAVILRQAQIRILLGCVFVCIVALALYGLATRLFPDRLSEYDTFVAYRLSAPLGYWNAVAGLTAIGMLLATGFAARARTLVLRGLAAGALTLLLPTFYFTFGRGGWLALFGGLLVTLLLDPRRLQYTTALLLAAPWALLALWQAHGADGLTTDFSPLAEATGDGERFAWVLGLLALGAIATTVVGGLVERRLTISSRARSAYAIVLALLAATLAVVIVVNFGGPAEIVRDARETLKQSSPNVRGDQSKRLLSLSPNGRFDLWEVALGAARADPLHGIGAGAYEQRWNRDRPLPSQARDAHSLPIEMVGELGLFGLLALGLAMVVPFVAAVRARSHPLVPVAAGCFAAYLVHAAVDWDWEMPVLTLSGLACAGVALAAARDGRALYSVSGRVRSISIAALAALGVVAFVGMVSNRALTEADEAATRADNEAVISHAKTAARWAPWSSEPLRFQADAALSENRPDQAATLYRRAIAKDRTNWELWFGLALSTTGATREAALREATRLNPLSTEIRQVIEAGV